MHTCVKTLTEQPDLRRLNGGCVAQALAVWQHLEAACHPSYTFTVSFGHMDCLVYCD